MLVAAPIGLPGFAGFAVRTSTDPGQPLLTEEAAQLHPRAVPARRESFRLGRSAAHAALASIGRDLGPILVGADRQPIWPEGVVGSISHTCGTAVALVAPAGSTDGVGVDIEEVRHAPELEGQVPRPEEFAWLDELAPPDRERALFALFSAKESIFKAFFPATFSFFGFDAASLTPTASGFDARLVQAVDDRYPETRRFGISCQWFAATVLSWLVLPSTDQAGEARS